MSVARQTVDTLQKFCKFVAAAVGAEHRFAPSRP